MLRVYPHPRPLANRTQLSELDEKAAEVHLLPKDLFHGNLPGRVHQENGQKLISTYPPVSTYSRFSTVPNFIPTYIDGIMY